MGDRERWGERERGGGARDLPGCGLQDEKANFELIGERANERERERGRDGERQRESVRFG